MLKQSKDPDYADAVYACVLRPGRWRTCNDTQKQQKLCQCTMCGKILPEEEYESGQWQNRLHRKASCKHCRPPKVEPTCQYQ
eukprot:7346097-Karenia_brevis.AAC.1